MSEIRVQLKQLYQDLADHTLPECKACRNPCSCCSPEYCRMTQQWAESEWGNDLSEFETGHTTLPYMGDNGCTVPPHMRPICTMHTCEVNSIGFKKNDTDWTDRYFELREKINELEYERTEEE